MADQYVNVNGVWRKASPKAVVVDGVNRQVQNTFVVDNGVIRKCWDNFNPDIGGSWSMTLTNSYSKLIGSLVTMQQVYDAVMAGYTYFEANVGITSAKRRAYDSSVVADLGVKLNPNNYSIIAETSAEVAALRYYTNPYSGNWSYGTSYHFRVPLVQPSHYRWGLFLNYVNSNPSATAVYAYIGGIYNRDVRYGDGRECSKGESILDREWDNVRNTSYGDSLGTIGGWANSVKFTK